MDTDAIRDRLLGRTSPYPYEPPDANQDGQIDVADLVMTILHNPPADLDRIVPSVDLTLSAQSIRPGDTVELAWALKGVDDPTSYALQIVALSPGGVSTGTLEAMPGVVPANGAIYYLQSGRPLELEYDYWSNQMKPFSVDAVTTDRTATACPYPELAGEWLIQARLLLNVGTHDTPSYELIASDEERVLVLDGPALRLRLNRMIANTGDEVRTELITAAGATPTTVSLAAWLETPDGAELGLPNFEPGLAPLWAGPASDRVTALFTQPLGGYGHGRFVIHASMTDGASGRLLALAEAPLLISDTPTTMSGGVLANLNAGTPINGLSFALAQVQALEIHDQEHVVANVDATGTYTLTLRPGSYLVSALVLDGLNLYEQSLGIIEIHGDEVLSRNILMASLNSAQGSQTGLQRLASAGAIPVGLSSIPGNAPSPKVLVQFTIDRVAANSRLEALARSYVEELRRQMPQVEIHTADEVKDLLSRNQLEAANDMLDADYLMNITLYDIHVDSPMRFGMLPTVLAMSDARALSRAAIFAPTDTELLQNSRQEAQEKGPSLQAALIANQDWPRRPTVRLELLGSSFWPGQTIEARVTLTESDGTPVDGKMVTVQHWAGPTFDIKIGEAVVETGTAGPGQAIAQFTIPRNVLSGTEGPQCELQAFYERRGSKWEAQPRRYPILPVGSGPGLRLFVPADGIYRANYLPDEYFPVYFSLKDDQGNPIGGASIGSWCVNCKAQPEVALTNAQGIAEFLVTPGQSNGYAVIQAICQPPGETFMQYAKFPFQVIGGLWVRVETGERQQQASRAGLQTTNQPQIEGAVPLFVDVFKGDDKIPGAPISLTLTGDGTLLGEQTQTYTDGVGRALFIPPDLQSGTVTIRAVAQVGDEKAEATADVDYDPGLIIQAYIPDFIDENGVGTIEIRVGRAQADGDPVWEKDVQLSLTGAGGTVTPTSGVTDTDGRLTAQVDADIPTAGMDIVIEALAEDGRTATKTLRAVHQGTKLYAYSEASTWSFYTTKEMQVVSGQVRAQSLMPADPAEQEGWHTSTSSMADFGHLRVSSQSFVDPNMAHLLTYGATRCEAEDVLLINDPDKSGEWGTARVITRRQQSGLVRAYWDPYDPWYSYFCECWADCSAGGVIAPIVGGGVYPGPYGEAPSPLITTLTFTYGRPFTIITAAQANTHVRAETLTNDRFPGAIAAAAVEIDAYISIVPDNPNATMTSQSGHRY